MPNGDNLLVQQYGIPLGGQCLRDTLPHLAGAETRIAKLVDQCRDDGAAALWALALGKQCALDGLAEVQSFDALRGPIRGELFRTDAPHLLAVGFEKNREEPVAELIAPPFFSGLGILDRTVAPPD